MDITSNGTGQLDTDFNETVNGSWVSHTDRVTTDTGITTATAAVSTGDPVVSDNYGNYGNDSFYNVTMVREPNATTDWLHTITSTAPQSDRNTINSSVSASSHFEHVENSTWSRSFSSVISEETSAPGSSSWLGGVDNTTTALPYNLSFVTYGSPLGGEVTQTETHHRQDEDQFTGLHDILGSETTKTSPSLAPLGLVVIIALTIIGNVIVCLAVKMDKRLHHMTYFFFVSMAALHITMAALLMPPATMIVLTGSFLYTDELCKVWVTLDFFFCNCTCLHLAFVNMDTFLRLKDPLRHGRVSTTCSLILWLGASWVISIVQSVAQFMLSQEDKGILQSGICFIRDKNFIILGILFSFLIPTIIAVTFYGLCVNELRILRAGKFLDDSEASLHHAFQYGSLESIPDDVSDTGSYMSEGGTVEEMEREEVQLAIVTNMKQTEIPNDAARNKGRVPGVEETTSFCNETYSHDNRGPREDLAKPGGLEGDPAPGGQTNMGFVYQEQAGAGGEQASASCTLLLRDSGTGGDQGNNGLLSGQVRPNAEHDHDSPDAALRQEVAISRLMFLLLLLSITLWIPYSASNLVYGICEHCTQNMTFEEMMTFKWIAYSSAMIGPWIYMKFSRPLRNAIWSIFCCKYCHWEEC